MTKSEVDVIFDNLRAMGLVGGDDGGDEGGDGGDGDNDGGNNVDSLLADPHSWLRQEMASAGISIDDNGEISSAASETRRTTATTRQRCMPTASGRFRGAHAPSMHAPQRSGATI